MSSRSNIAPSKINLAQMPGVEEHFPQNDPYRDGKDSNRKYGNLQGIWNKESGILRFLLLTSGFLLLFATEASAQQPFAPLKTESLSNSKLFQNIYLGQFERIPFIDADQASQITDEGLKGRQAFVGYVIAYSDHCQDSLPPNKVPINETITTSSQRQELWLTRFGVLVGPTRYEETKSETRFSSVWADPKFADTYVAIANSAKLDALASLFIELRSRQSDNLAGASLTMLSNMLTVSLESRVLIARHGCASREVKIYGENLLNYVRLQPPAYRDPVFLRNCNREIGKIIPGASRQACPCLEKVFSQRTNKGQFWNLEDNFTEQNFLNLSVSKVDLHREVAACLK